MNRLLSLAAALTLVAACDYHDDKDKPASAGQPDTNLTGGAGTTSFAALQRDVFAPYCVSCHSAGRAADGVALDSFAGVAQAKNAEGAALVVPGKAEESLLYAVIASGSMPKGAGGKPTAQQLADLKSWIDAGADASAQVPTRPPANAPETKPQTPAPGTPAPGTPAPGNPTPEGAPTFASLSDQFLKAKCAGCHQPRSNNRPPAGGVPLHDYDALVAANADGEIFKSGDPDASELVNQVVTGKMPPRGDHLSADEVDLLKAWIKAGAPRG